MNQLGTFIDFFLYALVAVTLGLIAWKCWELYPAKVQAPESLGRTEHQLQERLERLEAGLTLLSAIGSSAAFIGLMGTVIHIVEALRRLGAGMADMSLVGGPIATALNTTLVGMFSAVPAVIAVHFFYRRIELLESRHRRLLETRVDAPASGLQG